MAVVDEGPMMNGSRGADAPSWREVSPGVGLVAVLTMMTLTSLRLVTPLAYHAVDTFTVGAMMAAAVAVAGLLVVLRMQSRLPGTAISILGLATAVLRWLAQMTIPGSPLVLVLVVVVAGAMALASIELVARSGAPLMVFAMLVGLATDVAVRGAFITVDPAWLGRSVVASAVAIVEISVLVVACAVWRGAREPPRGRTVTALGAPALGAVLVLQFLVFTNIGFVSSRGGWSVGTATALLVGGHVAAVLSLRPLANRPRGRVLVSGGFVALVLVVMAVTEVKSVWLALVLLVGSALTADLLAVGLKHAGRAEARSVLVAIAAVVGVPIAVVAGQLQYKIATPLDDRLVTLLAALMVGVAAFYATPRRWAASLPAVMMWPVAATLSLSAVVVAAVVAMSAPEPALAELSGGPLRILNYNVDNGITLTGRIESAALARVIESTDPDVVILQEVPRGLGWSAGLDLAEYLGRRLGMSYAFAPAADDSLGNLILSRATLHSARVVELPRLGRQARRSFLMTTMSVAGRPLTLANVHIQHGDSAPAARARLHQLERAMAAWGQQPRSILGGDLNAGPGSVELATILAAGFTTSADEQVCRAPTESGGCIDWLFVTPDLSEGALQVLEVGTSDHWPMLTTVSLRN